MARKANTIELGNYAVEKLPKGEFVRRVHGSMIGQRVFIRGEYDRNVKRYELQAFDDVSHCIYVKRGTTLHAGFTY